MVIYEKRGLLYLQKSSTHDSLSRLIDWFY